MGYLPVVLVVVVTMAVLLGADARRAQHWREFCRAMGKVRVRVRARGLRVLRWRWRFNLAGVGQIAAQVRQGGGGGMAASDVRASVLSALRVVGARLRRALPLVLALLVVSYIWTYQRAQEAIAVELAGEGLQAIDIGSLIIPYSAFFRGEYAADAGFSYAKKRARVEVLISGHVLGWGEGRMSAHVSKRALVRIKRLQGKKVVFSYLTDTATLRPVITRHMQGLVDGGAIAKYAIETFDNRGPYLLVALAEELDGEQTKKRAEALARGLFRALTQTHQLKVSQVVVKVVEAKPYIVEGTVRIIGRGVVGEN